MKLIKLTKAQEGYGSGIVPSMGEDLGGELAQMAEVHMKKTVNAAPHDFVFFGHKAMTLYYLAADAFRLGAQATIGHNRTGRYQEAAKTYEGRADEIAASIKALRDAGKVAP